MSQSVIFNLEEIRWISAYVSIFIKDLKTFYLFEGLLSQN